MKKYISNTSAQLLVIAASLVLLTGILSLSAYLTDITETTDLNVKTVTGDGVKIAVTTENYEKSADPIVPGQEAIMDPSIENTGDVDSFVFMSATPSTGLILDEFGENWTPVEGHDNVYAYVDNGQLSCLNGQSTTSNPLFSKVKFDPNVTTLAESYDVSITAYAIQAYGLNATNPKDVFEMVVGE